MSGCHAGCRDLHYNPESIRFCHRLSARNTQKTFLCSPFRNHPLSGSVVLSFDRFFLLFPSELPPQEGGSLGSSFFSFRGFFPCASRSSLISFFNCSSKNSASSSAIRFRIFFVCPCFYMGGIHEDLGRIDQSVFIAFLQDTGKKICSKRSVSLKRLV